MDFRHHAAQRWSETVVRGIDAESDPRTLALWARSAGISVGALRSWCRAARAPARSSLYFTRMLRALVIARDDDWDPFNLLDIVDDRTLQRLFIRCGIGRIRPTLQEFLSRQQLIEDRHNVTAVIAALSQRGIQVAVATHE